MKILHTADWHLGRVFYHRSLLEEQAIVLREQFLPFVTKKEVDVIIIAGDVFDRAIPPVEAVALWDEIVTAIADAGIPLFVIAGNHDSAERLQLNKRLLRKNNIYIEGTMDALRPITLNDQWGPIHFCLFPFGDPAMQKEWCKEQGLLCDEEGENSYDEAMRYLVAGMKEQLPMGERSVAVAHLFMLGGQESASERTLSLGGASTVRADIFKGFTYTALGHLHGAQTVAGGAICYSGSLLPYSFDEERQKKSFTIVTMGEKEVRVERIPIQPIRGVRTIEGTLQDILDLPPIHDYVYAKLTDVTPVIDGMARLKLRHPYTMGMELLGRMATTPVGEEKRFKHLDEQALFQQFAEYVWEEGLTEIESSYIVKLWEEVRKEEV